MEYLSLMSYSWSLDCASAVQSYSGATDPTFDDWGNLQGDFPNAMVHLGNTLGAAFGTFSEADQFTPEPTSIDYMDANGPPVTTPPTVAVTSPKANASVGLTLPLQVTVDVTDAIQVASVTVVFDVNGDGVIDTVAAKPSGTNVYKASFPALSGPPGTRTITAAAAGVIGNTASAQVNVQVEQPKSRTVAGLAGASQRDAWRRALHPHGQWLQSGFGLHRGMERLAPRDHFRE
jgi:hypothetical protein